MTQFVTATAGVLCLVAALLIATVGRMQWPRVVVALTLTGATGILNSTVGPPIRRAVNRADSKVSEFFGEWTGTAVTGVLAVVIFAFAAFWVWHKQINFRTLAVTAAVPPSVTLIPGMLGTVAVTVVGFVPWVVGGLAAWAFGLR